jgi:hypothetical protein
MFYVTVKVNNKIWGYVRRLVQLQLKAFISLKKEGFMCILSAYFDTPVRQFYYGGPTTIFCHPLWQYSSRMINTLYITVRRIIIFL